MRKWLGGLLALGTGIVLCLCGVAAPTAAAHRRDYDCADFASQAEAEEYLLPGDPYDLDGDSDGIACEDLPCPCSSSPGGSGGRNEGTGTVELPPRPKLNKAVARSAARAKARRFNRRNRSIDKVSFQGCRRRSPYKLRCRFRGRGETRGARRTCAVVVIVKGEGSHAHAKLRATCRRA